MTQPRKHVCFIFSVLCLLMYPIGSQAAGLEADWVLHNGKILTANTEDPSQFAIAQAVAIYDGKFVAVGGNQEALALAGSNTRRIDLQGKTVIPGMIETHLHLHLFGAQHHLGKTLWHTDLPVSWKSKQEVLERLRMLAGRKKPGEWIVTSARDLPFGARIDSSPFTPTLAELDQAVPNNPVAVEGMVIGGGYFPTLVNSRALEALYEKYPGISGVIQGSDGKPTGIIEITAAFTIQEFWPTPTQKAVEEAAPAYRRELEEAAARGLTALATRVDWASLRVYQLLDQREEMPMRLAYATEMAAYSPQSNLLFRRMNIAPGHGSPWLWLSGATTGTIEFGNSPVNGDSCIHGSYPKKSDDRFPNWEQQPWGEHGDCRLTAGENSEVLRNFFLNAVKNGWVVSNIHINGDKGLDDYMDLLEEAEKKFQVQMADLRFSSDHCGYVSEQQAERAKRLGISFTCTPGSFMNAGRGILGAYTQIYDRERAADAYSPFRRLARSGMKPAAHCEGHQDWTFTCLKLMITRKDQMTGQVWGPQQRIDRREALYTFTRWAAWHVWKENQLGSIEPGKWADLVVIDQDYLTVPEDQISDINPLLTIAGGKVVYSEPKFASSVGLPTVGFQAPPDWWLRQVRPGMGGM
ncbi:MAG: amidohydrolase family protein [Acidobacteria bacterium]|nr:amidohydrolase family protein [Acidobacteriota bacterium]